MCFQHVKWTNTKIDKQWFLPLGNLCSSWTYKRIGESVQRNGGTKESVEGGDDEEKWKRRGDFMQIRILEEN